MWSTASGDWGMTSMEADPARTAAEVAFDAARVYHGLGPGETMVIPEGVAVRITGLPGGGCRVEVLDEDGAP